MARIKNTRHRLTSYIPTNENFTPVSIYEIILVAL